jgi:hypothetical protein
LIIDVATSILHRRRTLLPRYHWALGPERNFDEAYPSFISMTGCSHSLLVAWAKIIHLEMDIYDRFRAMPEIMDDCCALENRMRFPRHTSTQAETPTSTQSSQGAGGPHHDTDMDDCTGYDTSYLSEEVTHHEHTSCRDMVEQCFYWATKILISRRLYRDPVCSRRVQFLVRRSIESLKSLHTACDLNSALALPFYITAREVLSQGDRDWILRRHDQMKERYPNPARCATMDLTKDVWEMVDMHLSIKSGDFDHLDSKIAERDKGVAFFVF